MVRELESEVERLKKARAELLLSESATATAVGITKTIKREPTHMTLVHEATSAPAATATAVTASPSTTTLEQEHDAHADASAVATTSPSSSSTSGAAILRTATTGLQLHKPSAFASATTHNIKEEPEEQQRDAATTPSGPTTPLLNDSADAAGTAAAAESPSAASSTKRRGRRLKDSATLLDSSSSSVLSPPPMFSPASPALLAQSQDDKQTRYQRAIMSSMNQVWNAVHRHKVHIKRASKRERASERHRTTRSLVILQYGPLFRAPVTEEEAPGYFDVIKQPMDLSTIKERLNSGVRICPLSVVPSSYRVRMHLWTTTRCSRSCLRRSSLSGDQLTDRVLPRPHADVPECADLQSQGSWPAIFARSRTRATCLTP